MDPISIDLRFNEAEVIFARLLRNMNATCRRTCLEYRLPARFAIRFLQTTAQFGIPLRVAHDELHAENYKGVLPKAIPALSHPWCN